MILIILGILILVSPIAYLPQLFKMLVKTSAKSLGPIWNVRSKGGYFLSIMVGYFC